MKKGVDEAKIAVEMEKWQLAQVERRQRDEARKVRRAAAHRKVKTVAEAESTTPPPPPAQEAPPQA